MNRQQLYDVGVIGGGIVGTATAMALVLRPSHSVIVLEAEPRLATHQTGRNSGVIHSGLYYQPGSLKARNCIEGREALYRFCEEHGVPFERCGKVIVAASEAELPALEDLSHRGRSSGLDGMRRLTPDGIREVEPNVTGVAGLWVPQAGIVDYARVTEAFARVVQESGGEILTGARFLGMRRSGSEMILLTTRGEVRVRNLVNCAGLQADRVARKCGASPHVRIVPFRGEYYRIAPERSHLVRNLVYPVPDLHFPFLGVHLTRLIDGGVKAGPNAVLALKREGYSRFSFSLRDAAEILAWGGSLKLFARHWKMGLGEMFRSLSKAAFLHALRKLVPEIQRHDLSRAPAGVRAQAVDETGGLVDDFQILEMERMIHVLNAPSPAATASISIGQTVSEMAERDFSLT